MKVCECGNAMHPSAKVCLECRRKLDRVAWKKQARAKFKGGPKFKDAGYAGMISEYNKDECKGRRKEQSYSGRECGITEATFTIEQGHRKPNAQ